MQHERGQCYEALLPPNLPEGDSDAAPYNSSLVLLENGFLLGPPQAQHELICQSGAGRFSHWGSTLYFSSSDNSDPRTNGRDYHVLVPPERVRRVQTSINILNGLADNYDSPSAYLAIEQCLATLYPTAKIGEDMKSFWRDDSLLEPFRKLSEGNDRSFERKVSLYNFVRAAARIDGDMAECGVYNGASAYFMALARDTMKVAKGIFLFDSFAGLSTPRDVDGSYWGAGFLACPVEVTRHNMSDFVGVHFIQAWIPDRFPEVADRKFCFVHIDVDLYEPTLQSLEFFFPRMSSGGMLLCDDYGFDNCPGARLAMDQYFTKRPEEIIHLPTGQGLIIKS